MLLSYLIILVKLLKKGTCTRSGRQPYQPTGKASRLVLGMYLPEAAYAAILVVARLQSGVGFCNAPAA
jgi:hypothetical protein